MDVVGTDRYIRFSGRFKCTPQHFPIGQIVHHKMLEYRGVIYDVDPIFHGLEEWYERVATRVYQNHSPGITSSSMVRVREYMSRNGIGKRTQIASLSIIC